MHSPDYETPLDETLRALDDLVRSGKVRYIGCSNYPAWLLTKGLWISDRLGLARFDCVQPRYNLLFRHIEAELFPLVLDQGIGVISYNPLAGGMLTGRYQAGQALQEGTRFALQNAGPLYRARYWQEATDAGGGSAQAGLRRAQCVGDAGGPGLGAGAAGHHLSHRRREQSRAA